MSLGSEDDSAGIRLNRYLAECGMGSRRKTEELILSGRVTIDGEKETEPGRKVRFSEAVAVDGKLLARIEKRYFLFHKPRGVVCAVSDKRERTVMELLEPRLKGLGLFPVGRLDKESEGLLLLTNDGDLAQQFIHPSRGVIKQYDIRLDRPVFLRDLNLWSKGTVVEGRFVKPVSVVSLGDSLGPEWIRVRLREGRKRELRVMAENCGFKVRRLIRTAIGLVELGNIPLAGILELKRDELLTLAGIGGPE